MGGAAIIEAGLLLVTGVSLGDSETLAFGVVVAATTGWFLWRSGRVPVLIRSLVFLDVLFFMTTATIANLTTHESLGAVALPLALAVTSATGLVATTAYLIRGRRSRSDHEGPGTRRHLGRCPVRGGRRSHNNRGLRRVAAGAGWRSQAQRPQRQVLNHDSERFCRAGRDLRDQ